MQLSSKSFLLAAAIVMAAACAPAHAEGSDSTGKKQALIRLLVRAGKTDEAAAAMRSLYPKGPPNGGQAALDYYDVIGNTGSGWEEAKDGLEKLVRAEPGNVGYQLMLAKHLCRRSDTRGQGLQIFVSLSTRPNMDRGRLLAEWRSALGTLDNSAASMAHYRDYLAVDPGNAKIREDLADAQRAETLRLPWQMRDKADAQLAGGRPEEAMATLKNALRLDPKNAWVRFDLSRLYHKRGERKRGRDLMAEGLSVARGDSDMLYANALYAGLLGEPENALRLLNKIPAKERSPAVKRLRRKMEIQAQTLHAEALAREGRSAEMQAAMRRAEADAGNDAELVNIAANAWIDLNDPVRGVALMQRLAEKTSPLPSAQTLLYYAKVLNRAEYDAELSSALARLSASRGLSASGKEDLRYLHAALAARRGDTLRHDGKIEEARSVLVAALEDDPADTDMLMALARVHVAAHEPQQARAVYQRILQRKPGYISAQMALESVTDDTDNANNGGDTNDAGSKPPAKLDMAAVLAKTPAYDIDGRVAIADWYIGKGDTDTARTIVEQLRKVAPDNPRVLVEAGRLAKAERNYGDAFEDFRRANAREELAEIERLRGQGDVAAGLDYISKTGSVPGISNLKVLETPVEGHIPIGYEGGRAFVQVDPAVAEAGTPDTSDHYSFRQFGKVLALSPGGMASAPAQRARGAAMAVGYEGDGLRADIGTTPLGFPVAGMVGGVKWSHYTEVTGFSLDVSRRPMTSSLLSYAGMRDPVTGEVWGGVRSNGVGLHVSRDFGRLTVFAEPGYYLLTGQNVLSNTEAALRTGIDWGFIQADDMRLNAGIALTYWHYRENLRFYSFGHGGYYSPQRYYSLTIPFRWTGREERWSYMVQGSVSATASYEKDMPFYPTSTVLQAQGVANSATMTPTYTGGKGHGTGFSFGGALEYELTPHLFGGARLQIDRSAYYTPNFAIFYLRYLFDAHSGAVPYPPDPIKAYSRF